MLPEDEEEEQEQEQMKYCLKCMKRLAGVRDIYSSLKSCSTDYQPKPMYLLGGWVLYALDVD